MKRHHIAQPEFYTQNRKDFMAKMAPNSIAIFHSGDQFMRSADATHTFYQSPDLFYLTGIDQEDTTLILFPDAPVEEWKEILFTKETSEYIRIWEGFKYTKEEAKNLSGIVNICWASQLDSTLKQLMIYCQNVYINLNEHSRAQFDGDYKDLRMYRALQNDFPLHTYLRSGPILSELRVRKKDFEISLLQQAANITADSFVYLLKNMKRFKYEFEIEAEITYFFNKNKAVHAYSPIIAAGKNANILHYNDNNQPLNNGDWILMDYGALFGGYAADMTRTVPYSGRFTPRQKQVYTACLQSFKKCKALMQTEISLSEYNKEAKKIVEAELIALGLLDANEVKNQSPENPLYLKYFPHGVSHYLGLDVHDVGNHFQKLVENAVLTCEPGIYIQEEGLGIRLENDIVLKSNGQHLDLLANCPIEIEEIESLMN